MYHNKDFKFKFLKTKLIYLLFETILPLYESAKLFTVKKYFNFDYIK